jgi:hypothetical protein
MLQRATARLERSIEGWEKKKKRFQLIEDFIEKNDELA